MRHLAIVFASLLTSTIQAQDAQTPTAPELATVFRSLLVPNLPKPLIEQKSNWDHQELVSNGLRWDKKGILYKPEIVKKLKNDGTWRKIAITIDDTDKGLDLRVMNVKVPETGRLTFSMLVQMPVHIKFEQQLWRSGTRLYSGETRARCNVILELQCESISRFDRSAGSFLPDLVMRLRVQEAKLRYSKFVVEHTAGVGGDIAKVLGEAVHDMIKGLKPSLEKNLLAKANAAIVKAADTKEVRVSLSKLLNSK